MIIPNYLSRENKLPPYLSDDELENEQFVIVKLLLSFILIMPNNLLIVYINYLHFIMMII